MEVNFTYMRLSKNQQVVDKVAPQRWEPRKNLMSFFFHHPWGVVLEYMLSSGSLQCQLPMRQDGKRDSSTYSFLWRLWLGSCRHHFCSHSISKSLVMWLNLATGKPGKCSQTGSHAQQRLKSQWVFRWLVVTNPILFLVCDLRGLSPQANITVMTLLFGSALDSPSLVWMPGRKITSMLEN